MSIEKERVQRIAYELFSDWYALGLQVKYGIDRVLCTLPRMYQVGKYAISQAFCLFFFLSFDTSTFHLCSLPKVELLLELD